MLAARGMQQAHAAEETSRRGAEALQADMQVLQQALAGMQGAAAASNAGWMKAQEEVESLSHRLAELVRVPVRVSGCAEDGWRGT